MATWAKRPCHAQCKLAWEDNEEEYEDFYDWGDEDADSPAGALTWLLFMLSGSQLERPCMCNGRCRYQLFRMRPCVGFWAAACRLPFECGIHTNARPHDLRNAHDVTLC